MILKIGFSTCPNDTFIFDAMINNKIDTQGLAFDIRMADVEELNKEAFNNNLDITKLSYHAYAHVSQNYALLSSGSALGNNNGPLLISKYKIYPDEIDSIKVAIPGEYTTANMLLSIAYPNLKNKKEYLFSDIEEAVLSNEIDAGLIIHENRFTYKSKGLKKIIDLGEYWEEKTKLPIPLGGIVINRKISTEIQKKIEKLIAESINYAYNNPKSSLNFIKQYAQEMKEEVMYKHINLYVNKYSINIGEDGKKAIKRLYDEARKINLIPEMHENIFV